MTLEQIRGQKRKRVENCVVLENQEERVRFFPWILMTITIAILFLAYEYQEVAHVFLPLGLISALFTLVLFFWLSRIKRTIAKANFEIRRLEQEEERWDEKHLTWNNLLVNGKKVLSGFKGDCRTRDAETWLWAIVEKGRRCGHYSLLSARFSPRQIADVMHEPITSSFVWAHVFAQMHSSGALEPDTENGGFILTPLADALRETLREKETADLKKQSKPEATPACSGIEATT